MVKEIPLSRGMVALIDDEDFELVSAFKWYANRSFRKHVDPSFYARTRTSETLAVGGKKSLFMHRLILGCRENVDHRDGNGLNNQRSNLRPATQSQNIANTTVMRPNKSSKFRGVTWKPARQCWTSRIRVNGRDIWIGRFDSEVAAGLAYDEAARRIFGEFARLNFPTDQEQAA